MLKEVDRKIDEIIDNKDLDNYEIQKYFFDAINNAKTQEQLDKVKEMLPQEYAVNNEFYEGGLIFNPTDSRDFQSLNKEQNFMKNKIIMKLDVLNKSLINGVSNKFLIQTIGNAFSSLEIIHYKDVVDEIIETPKKIMEILALLQQVPFNINKIEELKELIIMVLLVRYC